jgi:hypothetical protein
MGNSTVTRSTWALGVVSAEKSGYPIFIWGLGELKGETSPVYFSARYGDFVFSMPRQERFGTKEIEALVARLFSAGLSEPPMLREVQGVYERFADKLKGVSPDRIGEIYDQLEYEWRSLLTNTGR